MSLIFKYFWTSNEKLNKLKFKTDKTVEILILVEVKNIYDCWERIERKMW